MSLKDSLKGLQLAGSGKNKKEQNKLIATMIEREELYKLSPTTDELACHHGPYIKLMHEIFCVLPAKDISANNLEMMTGMKRIIQLNRGSGVLPDGTSESASQRRAKGIPNTQYSRGEFWVQNAHVRLYSLTNPKSSDFHYFLFFPSAEEVYLGHTKWKIKWIYTGQDKYNPDARITLAQGVLSTFFISDGDTFRLEHLKRLRHEFETHTKMRDLYLFYVHRFSHEPLGTCDDINHLFTHYSTFKTKRDEEMIRKGIDPSKYVWQPPKEKKTLFERATTLKDKKEKKEKQAEDTIFDYEDIAMDQTPSANPCYDPRGSKGFFDVWEDDETVVPPITEVYDEDEGRQAGTNTNSNFNSNSVRTNPGNYASNGAYNSNPGELSPRRDESRGRERRQGVTGATQSVQIANQLSLSGPALNTNGLSKARSGGIPSKLTLSGDQQLHSVSPPNQSNFQLNLNASPQQPQYSQQKTSPRQMLSPRSVTYAISGASNNSSMNQTQQISPQQMQQNQLSPRPYSQPQSSTFTSPRQPLYQSQPQPTAPLSPRQPQLQRPTLQNGGQSQSPPLTQQQQLQFQLHVQQLQQQQPPPLSPRNQSFLGSNPAMRTPVTSNNRPGSGGATQNQVQVPNGGFTVNLQPQQQAYFVPRGGLSPRDHDPYNG